MTTITIDRRAHVSDIDEAPDIRSEDTAHERGGAGRETALRAAARRNGLTMTALAGRIGVTSGHL